MKGHIKPITAILAKKAGYKHYQETPFYLNNNEDKEFQFFISAEPRMEEMIDDSGNNLFSAPSYHMILEFIREEKGIHITIERTASGYRYCLSKSDSGTNLGTSHHTGPNHAGQWDVHDTCLDNAINVALSLKLPMNNKLVVHWSNFASHARIHCDKNIKEMRSRYPNLDNVR